MIACLSAAPLCAQQADPTAEVQKNAAASGNASASGNATATGNSNGTTKTETQVWNSRADRHQGHNKHGMPQEGQGQAQNQNQKPVAYLGVLTSDVPPELRAQFSLADGFGLMVDEVITDSPAQAAGLKKYDVLVKFEDQKLVNMDQLMSLVHAKKKGDVVQMGVISGGKETQVSVTLGEHMIAPNNPRQHQPPQQQHTFNGRTPPPNGNPFPHGEMFHGHDQRGLQQQGNAMREQAQRFQEQMRDYQQRLQDWTKSGGQRGPMPQPPVWNLPGAGAQQPIQPNNGNPMPPHNIPMPQVGVTVIPGGNSSQFSFSQSSSNVTQRDDSGEYTLKTENGKSTFTVRPANGPEQSWPVNTDDERNAVPQGFRDKLRSMNGATSGIHIEINPGQGLNIPGNPTPAAPGGVPQKSVSPQVKAKTTSA